MKIRGVLVHDYYTGLCNQLIQFTHGIINCITDAVDVMVVDDFKLEIHRDDTCPMEEIIDLASLNEYLRKRYGLLVIGKSQFDFRIEKAIYGTMSTYIDVKEELVANCFQDGGEYFYIPPGFQLNSLHGDPAPNRRKSLRVTYSVGCGHLVTKTYAEESVHIECHTNPQYERYPHWPHQMTWFNELITHIRFHPSFYEIAKPVEEMCRNIFPVHVVHIRMEPDAVQHWSRHNEMGETEFCQVLASKYIEAIEKYMTRGTILVLSYTEDNMVIDWLKDKNMNYIYVPKDRSRGREWNAILDMVVAEQVGSGAFLGNFDVHRMQGSTFSYFVMKRFCPLYRVLIDIERIRDDVVVI